MPVKTVSPENAPKQEPPKQETPKQEESTLVQQSGTLGFVDDDEASGEITSDDIKYPRISVVHNIGELSEIFPGQAGAVALNKDGILCPFGGSLEVIAVHAKKAYEEDVGFDSGKFGKRVLTAQAVLDNGGSLMRGDEHYYAPIADILFLIKQPEKIDPIFDGMFLYEVDGDPYLLAIFSVRSTAYGTVAMPLWTLKQQRGSIRASRWKLTTVAKSWQGKNWKQPTLRPAGVTSDACLQFIKGLKIS